MIKKTLLSVILTFSLFALATAHCQIPCGIYGDEDRFKTFAEDVVTLKKSVAQIEALSGETPVNYNQLVRWVETKEDHADKISDVVLKYFLQQRIKPTTDHYEDKLVALHSIVVLCMKVKQSVDAEKVAELEKAIDTFEELYLHHHH